MMTILLVLGIIASWLVGALFSGLESSEIAQNRLKVRPQETRPAGDVHYAYQLLSQTQSVIYVSVVGNLFCLICVALFIRLLVGELSGTALMPVRSRLLADALLVLLVSPLYAAFSIILPKKYFHRRPRSRIIRGTRPVLWVFSVVLPVIRGITFLIRHPGFLRGHGRVRQTERFGDEDLRQIFEPSRRRNKAESIDKRMIYGVFGLEQTIVREIMQPLVNVVAMSHTELKLDALLKLARESGHSRIPVYTNRVVNIDGVVNVLTVLRSAPPIALETFIRTPYYVPETMRADKLMRRMIRNRVDLAVVVDEYGGTVGIVTQEDVIEEIVGEIEDEFDPMRPTVITQPDGTFLVDGRMDIDKVNELFGLSLPNEDFDTLGGFIYDELGRIPRVGDSVGNEDMDLEVMSMDSKQIERVKLHLKPMQGYEDEEGEADKQGES